MWMDTKVCFGDVCVTATDGIYGFLLIFHPFNLTFSFEFTFTAVLGLCASFMPSTTHKWRVDRDDARALANNTKLRCCLAVR